MKRGNSRRNKLDSNLDPELVDELRGQTFTSVPERDQRVVPPAFDDDYSDPPPRSSKKQAAPPAFDDDYSDPPPRSSKKQAAPVFDDDYSDPPPRSSKKQAAPPAFDDDYSDPPQNPPSMRRPEPTVRRQASNAPGSRSVERKGSRFDDSSSYEQERPKPSRQKAQPPPIHSSPGASSDSLDDAITTGNLKVNMGNLDAMAGQVEVSSDEEEERPKPSRQKTQPQPIHSSPGASSDSLDDAITTGNLKVNMGNLDAMAGQVEVSSDEEEEEAPRRRRSRRPKPEPEPEPQPEQSRRRRRRDVDQRSEQERKKQSNRHVTYAIPEDDGKPEKMSMVRREVARSEVRSMATVMSSTSWRSAKTDMDRTNERLQKFNMNPEEIELEAERRARTLYAQMLRKRCPTIVQNKELLQRRQNRNFQVNANDDLIRAMSRPELVEMNKRLEGELRELDEELQRVTDEIMKLRKTRDTLKKQQERDQRRGFQKRSHRQSPTQRKPRLDSDDSD